MAALLFDWEDAGENRAVASVETERVAPQAVRAAVEEGTRPVTLPVGESTLFTNYTVYGSGAVRVESRTERKSEEAPPIIPLVGMQMVIPSTFQVTWYGRGPQETHADRKTGAAVGRYTADVDSFVMPYHQAADQHERLALHAGATGRRGSHLQPTPSGSETLTVNSTPEPATMTRRNTDARPTPEYRLQEPSHTYDFVLRPYDGEARHSPTVASATESAR